LTKKEKDETISSSSLILYLWGIKMSKVKESYLRWLDTQRATERLENYTTYDSYYNGYQDVNIPSQVFKALASELGTRLNLCRIVVDTPVSFMIGDNGIGIEVIENNSRGDSGERFLYDVYEENMLLDEEMIKLLTIMGKKGDVFTKLYIDEDDKIRIQVLRPELVFPRYESSDYSKMQYCAIKWFDEDTNSEGRRWKAQVFFDDHVDYYELGDSQQDAGSTMWQTEQAQWEFVSSEDNPLGFIPILHYKNTIDDLEYGVSDLLVMLDLQDAINKTITDMLLTMDNQSFQRLVIFGAQAPKGQELTLEPGKITEVPNENGRLDVINPSEIKPFLDAIDDLIDRVCEVTEMPRLAFSRPEGFPVSGYALRIRTLPLERKCRRKMMVAGNRLKQLNSMIFGAAKYLGKGDYTGFKTRVHFHFGLPTDELSQMQVQEGRLRMKVISRRTVMEQNKVRDIEIELGRIEEDRKYDLKQQEELMNIRNKHQMEQERMH